MTIFSFNKTIQIRLGLQFLTMMASMSVTPYLIVYFSSKLGTVVTGFMFLGVMTASVIGTFAGGYLSDRNGRKKVIIWAELFVFVCFLFVAFVNSPWVSLPYITFLLFVIIHFFTGMAGPAYQALIIDESNPINRRSIYTFSYWLNNLAVATGGIIGAFLFMNYHFILFLVVSFITFLSLLITVFFIKESYVPLNVEKLTGLNGYPSMTKSKLTPLFNMYKDVLTNKEFAALAFANLLIVSVEEQLTNFIGIRLSKELSDPVPLFPILSLEVDGINLLGILKTENTVLVVCLTIVVSVLLKKWKDRSVLLSGIVLYFLGFTIISFHQVPFILLIAMAIATIGELMHIPVKQTLLANMVPDHARSSYMAVFGQMTILGATSAGFFIIISSILPPFVISFLFVLMGTVTLRIFYKLTSSKETNQNHSLALD
ncbi:MFS transporter [Bacillus salitolerans]|uniref:MFS transporter n=1 Tax=Bacillus salitolerans TaxID=1437434 RepID=A0ABW4LQQ2_9BACI